MAQEIRLEPRGFDDQWAADAAEIAQWRSGDHGKVREPHDVAPQRRQRGESSRGKPRRRSAWFTVFAGGLCVGGLILYLLVMLSGIGPPKEFTQQLEVLTNAVPAAIKRELSRTSSEPPMTIEDRRREEEKHTRGTRQRPAQRPVAQPTDATAAPDRKEQAWQRFYQPSAGCQANEGRGTMACVNEYARAKMEFENRWADGRL